MEWFEYHLTQNGWVEGSRHIDPGKTIEIASPQNRVMTIRGHETFPHVRAEAYGSVEIVWIDDDNDKVKALIEKIGKLPSRTSHWGDCNI
jgi:hypothetical protein